MIVEELNKLRSEMRSLRQQTARLTRSNNQLHESLIRKEKENALLRIENKELKKELSGLKEKLDSTTNHKDKLAGMIFKTNVEKQGDGKKKGGQFGHKGWARNNPTEIDERKRCFLSNCPDCGEKLARSNRTYKRTVEDLPPAKQTIVTEYEIEKQYCKNCGKSVSATPKGTISRCPFGTNMIALVLTLKYRFRLPINKIQEYFKDSYSLDISQSGIQNILSSSRDHFGKEYGRILEKIRRAPYKHADETSWRIDGQNGWSWLFATPKEALYSIEETRGGGVPDKILSKAPTGVLVRDDYRGYAQLNMPQQSCWTHLLRASRDGEGEEAKELHQRLKMSFIELKKIAEKPFDKEDRRRSHDKYKAEIQKIINLKFKEADAKKVQVRIRNQNTNLITALLYDGVPLTNNHAERQIRPLAVQRKISGGSRSNDGAKTHAVNMSIIQTLTLRGKNIFSGLQKLLELPCHKWVGEG